jgi:hypothetical protein
MLIFPLLFVIVLPIVGWVAYFISAKTYKGLLKNNSKYARAIQVITFLASFGALMMLMLFLIVSNVSLER